MARPAPARQPAGQRAARRPPRRGRRAHRCHGVAGRAAARRGAQAVLRRLQPGAAHPPGQRRARRGRAALPLPRRARPAARRPGPAAGAPTGPRPGDRRAGRRAAQGGERARRPGPGRHRRSAHPGRGAARPAGRGRCARRSSGRLVRRLTPCPPPPRCGPPTPSSRCPLPTSRRSCAARCGGCSNATGEATRVRWPRSPEPWCTRSSRPRRRARPQANWTRPCARPGRGSMWAPPGSPAASSPGCAACSAPSTAGCGPAEPRDSGWSRSSSRCSSTWSTR